MSYRSWLKDVRRIQDLGDHLNSLTFRKPEDDDRDDLSSKKWIARLQQELPVADAYKRYFGSHLHDSWVTGIKRDQNKLRLTLHESDASIFSHNLSTLLEIDEPQVHYPVDLIFDDVQYLTAVRPHAKGVLKWADWERLADFNEDAGHNQFLYDWFFTQDGRLQWVADIWPTRRSDALVRHSIFLLVDCAEARAEDRRTAAIAQAFSPQAAQIWEDAINGVAHSSVSFDRTRMPIYIRERMAAHGYQLSDLRP